MSAKFYIPEPLFPGEAGFHSHLRRFEEDFAALKTKKAEYGH